MSLYKSDRILVGDEANKIGIPGPGEYEYK